MTQSLVDTWRQLRRAIYGLLTCWLLLTAAAEAHPLGQLNADSVAEYHLSPNQLRVLYHVTFTAGATLTRLPQLDKNGDGVIDEAEEREYLQINSEHFRDNLHLLWDGRELKLALATSHLEKRVDAEGLPRLALDIELTAPWSPDATEHTLKIDDRGFEGVGGWREIRAHAEGGLGLTAAPEPPQNAIEALQTQGEIRFHQGSSTWTPRQAPSARPQETGQDKALLKMLGDPQGGFKAVLLTLGLAFILGAIHALQPGHGKTIVGAYLIGSRGTVGHAILLGAIVTFTHTFSVILLGVAVLFAFQAVVPERLIPWLGFVSGLLVSIMGVLLLLYRDSIFGHTHSHGHHHDHHSHDHDHAHHHHSHDHHSHDRGDHRGEERPYSGTVSLEEAGFRERSGSGHSVEDMPHRGPTAPSPEEHHGGHSHTHLIPDKLTVAGLVSLGVSGGMVPCSEALVVLLGAIALKKVGLGLLVLLSFSAGLAFVLMAVGILMVKASHLFAKRYPSQGAIRRITEISYLVIILMGLFLAFQALWSGGIIGAGKALGGY